MRILQYDYSSIDFENLPPMQKSMQTDGYCKILLPLAAKPCLTVDGPLQYSLAALYIFSAPQRGLHPVLGNYQAELVLEHTPLTNGETLFMCFPIRTFTLQDGATFADDIIWKGQTSANLGSFLGEGEAFVYGSAVVLAKSPLFIQTDPSAFSRLSAAVLSSPAAGLLPQDGWLKNVAPRPLVIEGFEDEAKVSDVIAAAVEAAGGEAPEYEYEMECAPIDIGAEKVEMLQVPYNSDTLANTSTKIFMSTTFSVFMAGFIILLYFVFVPVLVPMAVGALIPRSKELSASLIFLVNLLWLFAAIVFVIYGATVVKNSPGVLNASLIVLMLISGLLIGVFLVYNYSKPPYFATAEIFMRSFFTLIGQNFYLRGPLLWFAVISLIVEGLLMGVGQVQAGLLLMIAGTLFLSGWTVKETVVRTT